MALSVNFPAGFQRLNPVPLDVSAVFDGIPAFAAYLTGGTAYPGQVVAVRTAGVPNVFVINEDMTYSPVGDGAGGIVGMFWIDQDNGNLYFVSDVGVRNPFELDDGYLYYVMPGV